MGIKQGDNIAPALFLFFLMQGMAECLETKHMREKKRTISNTHGV
jgi:hypothetical protein